jgi:predicted RNase H-like HicB family nuclease
MPRGGARENSGRKPKWNLGETKAIRVPVAIADTIMEIARRIDEGEKPESIIIAKSEATTRQPTKLMLNVLIENEKEGSISATVLGLPGCKAVGASRQEALARLRKLLTARLEQAEIMPLEIETQSEHPWMKLAAMFEDDSQFNEVLADIEAYGRELDAEMEEYYRRLDAEDGAK